jgi:small-conductance mechanosensitive channel
MLGLVSRRWVIQALIACACMLAALARAQATQPAESHAGGADEAPIVVFNRTVATLRASFLGTPPVDRARRTTRVVTGLLEREGPGIVTVHPVPQGNALMIDGALALLLTPGDADALSGETLDQATQASVRALEQVIAETREGRDRGRLLGAAARSGLATALVMLAAWLTWRARQFLIVRIAGLLTAATASAEVAGAPIFESARLRAVARVLVRGTSWFVLAILAYHWLVFVMTQFPRTRAWGERLGGFLLDIVSRIGGGVLHALPNLVIAIVILLIARGLIAAFQPVFDRAARARGGRGWLEPELVKPTRRIFAVIVWLFAIAMAYPFLPGSDSGAFKGISVLVGLMVTLGGSGLVGQTISGLILMYSRTLRVGEYVRINDQEGTVTELGSFTMKIRTGLGEEITLPNTLVLGSVTKNYSRAVQGLGYIVDTVVTIGYDTPWRQVEALLLAAAERTSGIRREPRPVVMQAALEDFYVKYVLLVSLEQQDRKAAVLTQLHANIQDEFNEHGVQIMSPHYLGDPASAKIVSASDPYAAPARPAGAEKLGSTGSRDSARSSSG